MRLLTAVVCWMLASVAVGAPRVATESGVVVGDTDSRIAVFKGMPYARPPVGDLRWAAPVQPVAWSEPRDATKFGTSCPQPQRRDRATNFGPTAEDCLYLNVWTPDVRGSAPVMVWIHGGAFRVGSAAAPFYDGAAFARSGVVFVSLNYRLGRFGFFAHPALGEVQGNFALMDQIAALMWIKRNIAAFGGDPAQVTVFGESAGGASVLYLLASPATHALFARAIVQSGGGHQISRAIDVARGGRQSLRDEGIAWAAQQNVATDGDAAALRALPADTVLGGNRIAGGIGAVAPVIDGNLVPDDPGVRLLNGAFNRVPVLVGANSHEASVLAAFGTSSEAVVAAAGLDPNAIAAAYGTLEPKALANALFGDSAFVAGARHVARSFARVELPAWLYHFDYVLERRRGKIPGAGHGSEIPFVFETLGQLPMARLLVSEPDEAMSKALHRRWVNFAKAGDPNGKGLPSWPRYEVDTDYTLVIGAAEQKATAGFRRAQLDLMDARWAVSRPH